MELHQSEEVGLFSNIVLYCELMRYVILRNEKEAVF